MTKNATYTYDRHGNPLPDAHGNLPITAMKAISFHGLTVSSFMELPNPRKRALMISYLEQVDVKEYNFKYGYLAELTACNAASQKWYIAPQGRHDDYITYIYENGRRDYLSLESKTNATDVPTHRTRFIVYGIDKKNSQQDTHIARRLIPYDQFMDFLNDRSNKAVIWSKNKVNCTSRKLWQALEDWPIVYESGMTVEWWEFEGLTFGE